jgi:hypothetical protein
MFKKNLSSYFNNNALSLILRLNNFRYWRSSGFVIRVRFPGTIHRLRTTFKTGNGTDRTTPRTGNRPRNGIEKPVITGTIDNSEYP